MTDESGAFLCFIDRSGIMDKFVPALKKIKTVDCDIGSLDADKKYPIGIVSCNGYGIPFVLYRSTSNTIAMGEIVPSISYNLARLSGEDYEAIKACEGIPLWK